MEKFRVDMVAAFAAALGETTENTRFVEQLPGLTSHIATTFAQLAATSIAKDIHKQTEGRITVNVTEQKIDVRDMIDNGLIDHVRQQSKEALQWAQKSAEMFRLPSRWGNRAARIAAALDKSDATTLRVQVGDLASDLLDELNEPLFLYIQPDRRQYFDQTNPPFGDAVADKFSGASRDIAAATRALALDEWTASVFHSMRVLEHGLALMAARFNVTFKTDSWHKVLKGIEDELNALRNKQGLTDQDRADITLFSDAASQFRHFKDAWRNHVSHGREHYDQRDAEKVWAHVREFMQTMAEVA